MKIELEITNGDELHALADFVRRLAAIQEGDDELDEALASLSTRLHSEPKPEPAPELKTVTEPEPKPVEKKRRGRPPKAADAAAHVAAVVAKRSAETPDADYTEKRRMQADPDLILGKAEDPPEVQAADAADEAAESAAIKTEDPKLTHDDIRQELGAYMRKYGMPAAQEDGPRLFKMIFPDATPAKISDIPDTQDDLRKVLAGIREMAAKNPYKRAAIAA